MPTGLHRPLHLGAPHRRHGEPSLLRHRKPEGQLLSRQRSRLQWGAARVCHNIIERHKQLPEEFEAVPGRRDTVVDRLTEVVDAEYIPRRRPRLAHEEVAVHPPPDHLLKDVPAKPFGDHPCCLQQLGHRAGKLGFRDRRAIHRHRHAFLSAHRLARPGGGRDALGGQLCGQEARRSRPLRCCRLLGNLDHGCLASELLLRWLPLDGAARSRGSP
mmetsp:Transcript_25702/g.77448  ORF Transcript_25702/g.77448 Transcript_25702/m.77448 type:complete len:215 (-) Transcript_25702:465-1109(-)